MKPTRSETPRGLPVSVVEALAPYRDRLARLSDRELAKLARVSASEVAAFRALTGAPPVAIAAEAVKPPAATAKAPPTKPPPATPHPAAKTDEVPPAPFPVVEAKAKRQKLDPYRHLMGTMHDAEVARIAGVSERGVWKHRQKHGIPPALKAKAPKQVTPKTTAPIDAAKQPTQPSTPIADTKPATAATKRAATQTTTNTAQPVPLSTPLPSTPVIPPPESSLAPRPRRSKLDAHRDVVGVLDDGEVAALAGLTRSAVAKYRAVRGIPVPPTTGNRALAAPTPKTSSSTITALKITPNADKSAQVRTSTITKARLNPENMTPERMAPVVATPSKTRAIVKSAVKRPGRSKLDAYRDIVGVLQDDEVAERAGVTGEAVRQYRVRYEIPSPYRGRPALAPAGTASVPVATPDLSKPAAHGTRAGVEKVEVPVARPAKAEPTVPVGAGPGKRLSKLEAYRDIIGVLPDKAVAERAGVGDEAVRRFRVALGLPVAPTKAPPVAKPTAVITLQPAKKTAEAVPVVPAAPKAEARPKLEPSTAKAIAAPAPAPRIQKGKASSPAERKPRFRPSKLDAHLDLVGVLPDRAVAERVGMTADGVRKYRVIRDIAPPPVQPRKSREPRPPSPPVAVESAKILEPAGRVVAIAPAAEAPPVIPKVEGTEMIAVVPEAELAPAQVASVEASPVASTDPSELIEAPEPTLAAYLVIAVGRGDEQRFTVIGGRMAEALARAETALGRRRDGPWRVTEMREQGVGLE